MLKKLALTICIILLTCTVAYAQDENCGQCHGDVAGPYLEGPHAGIDCSRCHQNGGEHAANPQTPPGVRVEANNCGECHQLQFEPENSMGFHNAAEARESLEQATAFATSASDQAVQALGAQPQPPGEDVPPARRFPWVPLLIGVAVVVGTLAYFIKRR